MISNNLNSESVSNTVNADSKEVVTLIPKSLGNFCFHYLFQVVKWLFFFWVISGVIVANLFELFFSRLGIGILVMLGFLAMESYIILHFALSDVFKSECLYFEDSNKFFIFQLVIYPILFVISTLFTLNGVNYFGLILYYFFGIISVVLNRKRIKTS